MVRMWKDHMGVWRFDGAYGAWRRKLLRRYGLSVWASVTEQDGWVRIKFTPRGRGIPHLSSSRTVRACIRAGKAYHVTLTSCPASRLWPSGQIALTQIKRFVAAHAAMNLSVKHIDEWNHVVTITDPALKPI